MCPSTLGSRLFQALCGFLRVISLPVLVVCDRLLPCTAGDAVETEVIEHVRRCDAQLVSIPATFARTMLLTCSEPVPSERSGALCHCFGYIKTSSSWHGYGFISAVGFDKELYFTFADVECEDLSSLRQGTAVSFMASLVRDRNSWRAMKVRFQFTGVLKCFEQLRNYGFIHQLQEWPLSLATDVWFARTDVVTENPLYQIGSLVKFQLYWGANGKPRARHVELAEAQSGRVTTIRRGPRHHHVRW